MKNISIRWRILAGIITINVIGMITVGVYLHESYSGELDIAAQHSATLGVNAWDEITSFAADEFGDPTSVESALKYAEALKGISGAETGVLIDKSALDEKQYAAQVEAAGLPNNWDERENNVLIASTDAAQSEHMLITAASDSIPETGKIVGVENGACSKTCHGAVTGSGDFWKVRWSEDTNSRAHTVFPIVDTKGRPLGVVYELTDISAQADGLRDSLYRTLGVITFGLVASTFLVAFLLNSLVFGRLNKMIRSMEDISMRVAGGDFDAHFTPDGSRDEIGRFEQFFARFLDLMSGTLKSLVR